MTPVSPLLNHKRHVSMEGRDIDGPLSESSCSCTMYSPNATSSARPCSFSCSFQRLYIVGANRSGRRILQKRCSLVWSIHSMSCVRRRPEMQHLDPDSVGDFDKTFAPACKICDPVSTSVAKHRNPVRVVVFVALRSTK
jgi:hypothetical protein